MGERPEGEYTIDRIDTNGNYEPGNCRWLPKAEQSKNRRNAVRYTIDGQTRSLHEWARSTGIPYRLLLSRHRNNWPAERALTEPAGAQKLTANYRGRATTIANLAREFGVNARTIVTRMRRGMTIEQAVEMPVAVPFGRHAP